MEIEFDPAKDAANIAQHGLSLARAGELEEAVSLLTIAFRASNDTASTASRVVSPPCATAESVRSACGGRTGKSSNAMGGKKPVVFDDDNPEWTGEDFARARPIEEAPEAIRAAFAKPRGHPKGSVKAEAKQAVSLRLDPDVLAYWRATEAGGRRAERKAFSSLRI